MSDTTHVVALSGGKDSTALALQLAEVEPRSYTYLITPTGNELPEMVAHWERLECLLGRPLTRVTNRDLEFWIEEFGALPNWRQRWCTRLLKIEPTIAFLRRHHPAIQYVGLRADEPESQRTGLEADGIECRFPLREWGWGLAEVRAYLRERGVTILRRTDCAWCFAQRLGEWRDLHQAHPALYAQAEALEGATGHTFRSPGRDSRPAPLAELKGTFQLRMIELDEDDEAGACRLCRM